MAELLVDCYLESIGVHSSKASLCKDNATCLCIDGFPKLCSKEVYNRCLLKMFQKDAEDTISGLTAMGVSNLILAALILVLLGIVFYFFLVVFRAKEAKSKEEEKPPSGTEDAKDKAVELDQ